MIFEQNAFIRSPLSCMVSSAGSQCSVGQLSLARPAWPGQPSLARPELASQAGPGQAASRLAGTGPGAPGRPTFFLTVEKQNGSNFFFDS